MELIAAVNAVMDSSRKFALFGGVHVFILFLTTLALPLRAEPVYTTVQDRLKTGVRGLAVGRWR